MGTKKKCCEKWKKKGVHCKDCPLLKSKKDKKEGKNGKKKDKKAEKKVSGKKKKK